MPSSRTLLELTRRYCEPHRHYHGIQHIAAMLAHGRAFELTEAQVLAIWFHDAVYDPRSQTNERDSADLAQTLLSAEQTPGETIDLVRQIVLDTIDHRPSCGPAEAVIDLDLSSLALPRDLYQRNTERIRREYAHLSEPEFAAGRRRFVESILERPRIFTTAWGAEREAAARANLQLDLAELD